MRPSLVDNRYRIRSKIGKDSIGDIDYEVDKNTGDVLAIKQLSSGEETGFQGRNLRLAGGFYLLARLAEPNVVRIYNYEEDIQGPYYTYEVLNGLRLSDMSTPTPYLNVCPYFFELSWALLKLHGCGIILRNLCPETLVLSGDKRVKLNDVSQYGTFGVTGRA